MPSLLSRLPILVFLLAGTSFAAEAGSVQTALPSDSAPTERPIYGPILSDEPAIRAEIKHLYLESSALEEETRGRLAELNRAYQAETDADFRWELANEMSELKKNLEVRSIEIGLEIARLNGQEERAAEFALALDQILNPENYFPAHRPDPAVKEARLRELGQ